MSATLPSDSELRLCRYALQAMSLAPSSFSLRSAAARFGMAETAARISFIRCAGIEPELFASRIKPPLSPRASAGATASLGFLSTADCSAAPLLPDELANGGMGMSFSFGCFETILGTACCSQSALGVLSLEFLDGTPDAEKIALARAQSILPNASFSPAPSESFDDIRMALAIGREPVRLRALLAGTPFQNKAWMAALNTPPGSTSSYAELSCALGSPNAMRAAGSAMGANRIALLVPCHRIRRSDGAIGGYKWGSWRKAALIALEQPLPTLEPGRI